MVFLLGKKNYGRNMAPKKQQDLEGVAPGPLSGGGAERGAALVTQQPVVLLQRGLQGSLAGSIPSS